MRVLDWMIADRGLAVEIETTEIGGAAHDRYGKPVADETVARAKDADGMKPASTAEVGAAIVAALSRTA
ncbi:MAG: hypothetical protein FJX56_05000 [Alphaproteobacteria bacterium]|nr:hypothetical protein [Alphaproteobacteria bacterium]